MNQELEAAIALDDRTQQFNLDRFIEQFFEKLLIPTAETGTIGL
jgi:hypothetical protein